MLDGSQFTIWWTDYSTWSRCKILSNIFMRPRSSTSVRYKSPSWNFHVIRFERGWSWSRDFLMVDTEDLKTIPPSESHVKIFKSKEVNILKRNNEFVFPRKSCKKDSSHPPLCTEREPTSGMDLNTIFKKKKKPEFSVALRTQLFVPKGRFPLPLNYKDVQRQTKTSVGVLHEATIGNLRNMDGETGHCKTWTERVVKHVEKVQAKSRRSMDRRKTKLDSARERGGIYFIPNDDLDFEDIMNNTRPERSMLGATLWKWIGLAFSRKSWIVRVPSQIMRTLIIESERIRTAKSKEKAHQNHIADRVQISMSHCVVHKPIPIPTVMKIVEDRT